MGVGMGVAYIVYTWHPPQTQYSTFACEKPGFAGGVAYIYIIINGIIDGIKV